MVITSAIRDIVQQTLLDEEILSVLVKSYASDGTQTPVLHGIALCSSKQLHLFFFIHLRDKSWSGSTNVTCTGKSLLTVQMHYFLLISGTRA